jgi:hypothetical protein
MKAPTLIEKNSLSPFEQDTAGVSQFLADFFRALRFAVPGKRPCQTKPILRQSIVFKKLQLMSDSLAPNLLAQWFKFVQDAPSYALKFFQK